MGELFRLSVVTGDATVLDTEVRSANLPMDFGSIGILVNHAPMLCAVGKGVLRCIREDGSETRIRVSDGVASVDHNELTLLCSDAAVIE